jgi:hypothetical protein
MQWRTPLAVTQAGWNMDHRDSIFCIGSCFSQNIGHRLKRLKFDVVINPFGTLFNPYSIYQGVKRSLDGPPVRTQEIFNHDGLYHHFNFHSTLGHIDELTAVQGFNRRMSETQSFLKTCSVCLITLGSASVFRLVRNGEIVANCHKQPDNLFTRDMLPVNELTQTLKSLCDLIRDVNSQVKIVMTVSPVRHVRDGLVANMHSKSRLLCAVHETCQDVNNCIYFPAFEIMMDDLRDYRFYNQDLVHPNEAAIDYIWDKFGAGFFSTQTRHLIGRLEKVIQAIEHRPFHPKSTAYQRHLQATIKKCEILQREFEGLSLENDITEIKSLIHIK